MSFFMYKFELLLIQTYIRKVAMADLAAKFLPNCKWFRESGWGHH